MPGRISVAYSARPPRSKTTLTPGLTGLARGGDGRKRDRLPRASPRATGHILRDRFRLIRTSRVHAMFARTVPFDQCLVRRQMICASHCTPVSAEHRAHALACHVYRVTLAITSMCQYYCKYFTNRRRARRPAGWPAFPRPTRRRWHVRARTIDRRQG